MWRQSLLCGLGKCKAYAFPGGKNKSQALMPDFLIYENGISGNYMLSWKVRAITSS